MITLTYGELWLLIYLVGGVITVMWGNLLKDPRYAEAWIPFGCAVLWPIYLFCGIIWCVCKFFYVVFDLLRD